jgi:membrane-associated phospholipid phosphatase
VSKRSSKNALEKLQDRQKDVKSGVEKVVEPAPKLAFYQRFPLFRAVLGGIIFSFAILTLYIKSHPVFTIDLPVTKVIQSFHPTWFDLLMKLVTFIGNPIPGNIIVLSAAIILWKIFKRPKEAGLIVFSAWGAFLVGVFFKASVGRPRPDPNLILQVGNFVKSDSFPSGHVLFFMSFYGFLLFLIYSRFKKTHLRKVLMIFMILLIILMGFSRIYLGAHWFSDVLGSYLIGTVWLYLMVYLYKKLIE